MYKPTVNFTFFCLDFIFHLINNINESKNKYIYIYVYVKSENIFYLNYFNQGMDE